MSRVTPLTIVLFSCVIFLASLLVYKKSTKELDFATINLINYNNLALKYSDLKSKWLYGSKVEKELRDIVKRLKLRNYSIIKKSKYIEISINDSLYNIDRVVNKLLNKNFILKKIDIKKDRLYIRVGY